MDTQTRHALKRDKFIDTAHSGLDWLQEHQTTAIRWAITLVVVLAAVIVGVVVYYQRSAAAEAAFGQAMNTYNATLAQPGQPAAAGETSFSSSAQRAKAANQQFLAIANRYGMLEPGKNALYFAGITAMEMGQNGQAEVDLKKVADFRNTDLSSLGKLALASLYRQTHRNAEAVALYKQLIAKPSVTVPASAAQLELAGLYEANNPAEADRIYAQLKNDKGPAGQIAAQKLGPNK